MPSMRFEDSVDPIVARVFKDSRTSGLCRENTACWPLASPRARRIAASAPEYWIPSKNLALEDRIIEIKYYRNDSLLSKDDRYSRLATIISPKTIAIPDS